jgi:hypothetical protein
MMKFLKQWYETTFKAGQDIRKATKEHQNREDMNQPIGVSMYTQDPNETKKEVSKRMKAVHLGLKYKLLYPAIKILKWYNKKYFKGIPNTAHNRNLLAFDRAVEKSIEEWHTKALANSYKYPVTNTKKYWQEQSKKNSGDLLRTAKETIELFAMTDTAYKNFIDILMFNITLEIQREYQNTPADRPQHIIYNFQSINQPEYFWMYQCSLTKDLSLYREDDRTCCERQAIKEAAEVLANGKRQEVEQKAEELRAKGVKATSADKLLAILEQMERDEAAAKAVLQEVRLVPGGPETAQKNE